MAIQEIKTFSDISQQIYQWDEYSLQGNNCMQGSLFTEVQNLTCFSFNHMLFANILDCVAFLCPILSTSIQMKVTVSKVFTESGSQNG